MGGRREGESYLSLTLVESLQGFFFMLLLC